MKLRLGPVAIQRARRLEHAKDLVSTVEIASGQAALNGTAVELAKSRQIDFAVARGRLDDFTRPIRCSCMGVPRRNPCRFRLRYSSASLVLFREAVSRRSVPSDLWSSKALKSLVSAAAKSGFWYWGSREGEIVIYSLCLMGLCRHVDRLAEVERNAN